MSTQFTVVAVSVYSSIRCDTSTNILTDFGFNSTSQDLMASDCTSCEVTQDKSAYWTPSLHFLYPNGTSVIVPQVGGMLA